MKFLAGFALGAAAGKPIMKAVRIYVVPVVQRKITASITGIFAWSEGYLAEHDKINKENNR